MNLPCRKGLRNNATPAEIKLWGMLQHSNLGGYKFRRQHSVGSYILDFYCPFEKLAIELDGDTHFTDEAIAHDMKRTSMISIVKGKAEISLNLQKVLNPFFPLLLTRAEERDHSE
ncbi:MAG: DUF559 domain-containing protein, partial [Proteobacteria bacterium]|nr:DUF559 domain-containing protein [Pseudomonadota bacterium]